MSSCHNNEASLEHFHGHGNGESAAVLVVCLFIQKSVLWLESTCVHLSVLSGRPVWNDALHLQELVRLVAPDDREAEAHVALLQGRRQESALQLGWIPCKQGLLCRTRHEILDAHVMCVIRFTF